jgi:hypothetical protein
VIRGSKEALAAEVSGDVFDRVARAAVCAYLPSKVLSRKAD